MPFNSLLKRYCVMLICIMLSACSTIQESYDSDHEKLLLAAGFEKKIADSPEKLQHVLSMQQGVVISKLNNGKQQYLFADAKNCSCLYVGTQEDYNRYQESQSLPVSPDQRVNPATNWYWP